MENGLKTKQVKLKAVLKKSAKQLQVDPLALIKIGTERFKKLAPHIHVFVVALLIAVGFAVYFWYEASALKDNPQKAAQEETKKLLAKVSALIILPEGENPIISSVVDPEKLKNQPFFIKASAGDKVFIYTNSKKAILYNPTINKIVEVAPINIGNQTSQTPVE